MLDLVSKISKKISRGRGVTPSRNHTPYTGVQAPPLLGPRSRKPFPQIKIYHYTPDVATGHTSAFNSCISFETGML